MRRVCESVHFNLKWHEANLVTYPVRENEMQLIAKRYWRELWSRSGFENSGPYLWSSLCWAHINEVCKERMVINDYTVWHKKLNEKNGHIGVKILFSFKSLLQKKVTLAAVTTAIVYCKITIMAYNYYFSCQIYNIIV
jgi:hypothetical protein